MTIRFRYFPYLVQQKVMHHMDFIDVFSLYAISQKSQALAKSYFNRLDCSLSFEMGSIKEISIKRNSSSKNYSCFKDLVNIQPMMQKRKRVFDFCSRSEHVQIPVKNSGEMYEGVLKFAQELFPKIVFSFAFKAPTLKDFRRIMNLTKTLNVPIKEVDIYHSKINDSLMRSILTECSDVKILNISGLCPRFQYDFQTNPPFKFDTFRLLGAAEWITKEHLVNLFMRCKEVYLSAPSRMHYSNQELVEICKKWLEAPETQNLEFYKSDTFSEGIGEIPGAIELRGLLLNYKYLQFAQKKCYKVEKSDGTPAVIYHDEDDHIVLRTEFEYAVVEGDEVPEGLLERLRWDF